MPAKLSRLTIVLVMFTVSAGCTGSSPETPDPPPATGPAWFEDIAQKIGLKFTHDGGPTKGAYFMPQITGSGCAFLDIDGDGRLDIYLIQNGGPGGAKNQLFHQQPDGTVRDISLGSGLDVAGYGMGVAAGDVNNDGHLDVLLTEYGKTRLFLNGGDKRFQEVTGPAGIDNPLWATSASFVDMDRDGWLDLVVVNYIDYHRSQKCPTATGKMDFCGPKGFSGSVARLYRNLSEQGQSKGVRFEDVTVPSGLSAARGSGLGVLCADFNGDHWPDIFVANDLMANRLWINQRDGTFKDQAMLRGVAYTGSGNPAADMGIAWGDVDGNGLPDLFVTHLNDESHTLWKQQPRGFFVDGTAFSGLTKGKRSTGFGTAFADFNCDGWLDLAFVNGGVARNRGAEFSTGSFWSAYVQENQIFANTGKGTFRDITASNRAFSRPGVGRGLAAGDFDNDGAPDLLISGINGKARLLRNIAPRKGHWLTVRALLPDRKRDAYGAEITVLAGGKKYWRLLNPGYSYCSSNDPRCQFGLGPNTRYDAIEVVWPDGGVEIFSGGKADRAIEIRQGAGTQKQKVQK